MFRWGLVTVAIAAACVIAATPALATGDTTSAGGDTTTVTCTFDPSTAPGITTCSQRTDEVTPFTTSTICEPAGTFFDSAVLVYFHNDYYSSRTYRGNATLPGLNGVPLTADLGPVTLSTNETARAYDDAIYALVVRPHAHLESMSGLTTDRLGSYPVYVPVSSCG